ncbi:MAG: hypothetical protein EA402_09595 [Planctomycetota bacterium]|nr:MAG: hypothetical protein EA402_09595 [Planctomycetota bacterium]
MSDIVIPHTQLVDYIPHRGPNLMPDTVWLAPDLQSSRSETTILPDDPRGRDCFWRLGADGMRYWNEPFLGELVALTGVPMLTEALNKEGKVAVFSAISKAEAPLPAPFHATLLGQAYITRSRSGFSQFNATLSVDGEVVYRAEVMSGSAAMADIVGGERSAQSPLAAGEALAPFPWKPSAMTFIDRILSDDGKTLSLGYRYPETHPFVPGHFPEGPLMMGVTQWMAVADGLSLLLQRRGQSSGEFCGQGSLTRADGTEVASARGLRLQLDQGIARCLELRRIMFREVVRPGDELIINVSLED